MAIVIVANARPKFPLGEIIITQNALGKIDPNDVHEGLCRHASGDWGEICEEDRLENEHSLEQGHRLLSVFGHGEGRFWIITEWDRLVTTVLMPMDY